MVKAYVYVDRYCGLAFLASFDLSEEKAEDSYAIELSLVGHRCGAAGEVLFIYHLYLRHCEFVTSKDFNFYIMWKLRVKCGSQCKVSVLPSVGKISFKNCNTYALSVTYQIEGICKAKKHCKSQTNIKT